MISKMLEKLGHGPVVAFNDGLEAVRYLEALGPATVPPDIEPEISSTTAIATGPDSLAFGRASAPSRSSAYTCRVPLARIAPCESAVRPCIEGPENVLCGAPPVGAPVGVVVMRTLGTIAAELPCGARSRTMPPAARATHPAASARVYFFRLRMVWMCMATVPSR